MTTHIQVKQLFIKWIISLIKALLLGFDWNVINWLIAHFPHVDDVCPGLAVALYDTCAHIEVLHSNSAFSQVELGEMYNTCIIEQHPCTYAHLYAQN